MAVKALNSGDVSLVYLDNVGVNTRCKGVITTTTPSTLVPRTFLVLVLLIYLVLVGRKLLVLSIRYVSGGSVSRLNLSVVLLLFFCGPIPQRHLESISRVLKND